MNHRNEVKDIKSQRMSSWVIAKVLNIFDILSMTRVIDNRKLWLISYASLMKIKHAWHDWSLHCCLHCCCCFNLCYVMTSTIKYRISIIVRMIIEMRMLWLMEDCIISQFNHPVQGDYSKSTKFENSFLAFFKCLWGSKCDIIGKLNCKEHKRYQKD